MLTRSTGLENRRRWLDEDDRKPRRAPETQLWVDKYRPRRYTDLISDEVS